MGIFQGRGAGRFFLNFVDKIE
jgi:hypothetical protein